MPTHRISMRKFREVLRLAHQQQSGIESHEVYLVLLLTLRWPHQPTNNETIPT